MEKQKKTGDSPVSAQLTAQILQGAEKLHDWCTPISNTVFNDIEGRFGSLTGDLLEVANLVKNADDRFNQCLQDTKLVEKFVLVVFTGRKLTGLSSKEMGDAYTLAFSLQAHETLPVVMQILYSLKKYKRKIEQLFGKKPGEDFYNRLRSALTFVDITPKRGIYDDSLKQMVWIKDSELSFDFAGNDQWSGTRTIDDCVKTLHEWHEIQLCSTNNKANKVKWDDLNDTEREIIIALGRDHLTGERIAAKTNPTHTYQSNFKNTLSSLRKRGVLGNQKKGKKGYFLKQDYHHFL